MKEGNLINLNKKGQVTIFIIVAIILVGIIAMFFILRGITKPAISDIAEENPEAYMQLCIEDDFKDIVHLITLQGGFYDPKDYVLFDDDNKAAYLCKNSGNYEPCINQHPMYFSEISNEIKNQMSPIIIDCFDSLKQDFEEKGGVVELGTGPSIEVRLAPRNVFIDVEREITITRKEETISYSEVELGLRSSLYDLADVAAKIAHNEAEFCYFEFLGYTLMNPEYEISFRELSDSTHVYVIKDTRSSEEMGIATRGCALHD
jgi:hypothetical protein